jgi:hypothetical protein
VHNNDDALVPTHLLNNDVNANEPTEPIVNANEPTESIEDNPVPLHASLLNDYIDRNDYDNDDDEYVADYIDLVLFAIVSNLERTKVYQLTPTESLLMEIRNASQSIARAENCLNPHINRIILKFKSDINYDGIMSAVDLDYTTDDFEFNSHIQPTFFLEDADENEIAAYIDLIMAAIRTNMRRQVEYLKNPSPQLQQEIREHSTSIVTAENCTNVHIKRIISAFRANVHYDDIMAQTPNEIKIANESINGITMERTPNEIKIANESINGNTMERTPNEIKIANESINGITMERTPNEIEIANESINGITMEQTPNEIKIANESINGITMERTPNEIKIANESINGITMERTPNEIMIANESINGITMEQTPNEIKIANERTNGIILDQTPNEIKIANERTNGIILDQTPNEIKIVNESINGIILAQTPTEITIANESLNEITMNKHQMNSRLRMEAVLESHWNTHQTKSRL